MLFILNQINSWTVTAEVDSAYQFRCGLKPWSPWTNLSAGQSVQLGRQRKQNGKFFNKCRLGYGSQGQALRVHRGTGKYTLPKNKSSVAIARDNSRFSIGFKIKD